jgi:hypothetical protein
MEIIVETPENLQAVLYPTQGEGLDNLEFYVVRYISYRDPSGQVFLKGKGDWGPYNIGPVELEETYWVNIDTEFIEVFEKAKADGEVLYLEDVTPYSVENEIFR